MTSDLELLGHYARNKSEESFAALVQRHLNLVYSAAFPQVRSPQIWSKKIQSPPRPKPRELSTIFSFQQPPPTNLTQVE